MKHFRIILFSVLVAVLITGTVVEKFHDNAYACLHIYGSWWFCLLLGLVGLFCIYNIVKDRLWHSLSLLLLNCSVVFVLLGGLLTSVTGTHGSVALQPGAPASSFSTAEGDTLSLPFTVCLENFEVVQYPGTRTPMDFVSHITIDGEPAIVSMNNICRHKGYRLYQEDFDGEGGSTLSVAHDPWGIAMTYCGYGMMFLGFVLLFFSPSSRFRSLLRHSVPILVMVSAFSASVFAAPHTLPDKTADKLGRINVLYKGRVCPLQTLAKDFSTKLYGKPSYHGLSPEQVLSGWLFFPEEWAMEPMVKIKGSEVKQLLGTKDRYVSFYDLCVLDNGYGQSPMESMANKKLRDVTEKYSLIQQLVGGRLLKIFPVADSTGSVVWYTQNDDIPLHLPDDEYIFIRKQHSYCQELAVNGDYARLDEVFRKISKYQERTAGDILQSQAQYNSERLYNRLTTGRWLPMVLVTLGVLLFCCALLSVAGNRRMARGSTAVAWLGYGVSMAATLFVALIFSLRWIAGGHLPMAGSFDSMNLMSIAAGLSLFVWSSLKRFDLQGRKGAVLCASVLIVLGFCQLVAMLSGSNPPMTHLMPVLNSPLLALHVTVIMVSYALFFIVSLNSLAALASPGLRDELHRTGQLLLYPAVFLLAVGIAIGAVWANISWGNYWSWDPKEVWALITLIVYIFPLVQFGKRQHSLAFHIYSLLAFLSVLVTYFGVNLVLGGVHAYN